MNIQDAATLAAVLTQYELQPTGQEPIPLARLLEVAFPRYQWVWDPVAGRYEVLMEAGDGKQVRGVLEAKTEEPQANTKQASAVEGKLPFGLRL